MLHGDEAKKKLTATLPPREARGRSEEAPAGVHASQGFHIYQHCCFVIPVPATIHSSILVEFFGRRTFGFWARILH